MISVPRSRSRKKTPLSFIIIDAFTAWPRVLRVPKPPYLKKFMTSPFPVSTFHLKTWMPSWTRRLIRNAPEFAFVKDSTSIFDSWDGLICSQPRWMNRNEPRKKTRKEKKTGSFHAGVKREAKEKNTNNTRALAGRRWYEKPYTLDWHDFCKNHHDSRENNQIWNKKKWHSIRITWVMECCSSQATPQTDEELAVEFNHFAFWLKS